MFHIGQQIGVYTLVEKLGRGGFGEVWLAEKRSQFVTKKVAVKLPLEEQVNFESIRQEATLWEQASGHPNVLPIIDADVYEGQVVIVSEYANGGSLADKLKREGKLPLKQSLELTIGVLNGLEFLHNQKIIHRDIKPQNILLQGNTPRLADFGISRAMQTTAISSTIIGTDAYMSPESFDGKRSVQTDIWSVGVLLYSLLADNLPFPQEHPSERMFAILTKEILPLPDRISPSLQRIVAKALAKQPENRYQTAKEMSEELRRELNIIENPTFAPTEVLHIPIPKDTLTDITTIEELTQSEEAKKESINPPPVIQPKSVETKIEASQTVENKPVTLFSYESQLKSKIPTDVSRVLIAVGAGILMLLIVVAFLSGRKTASNSNSNNSNSNLILLNSFEGKAGKYGFKDSNGKVIIEPKYDVAFSFYEGLAGVKLNGKWGFIDANEGTVIPFKYDNVGSFSEGLAFVKSDDKWGFINKTDQVIIPFKFKNGSGFASRFEDGLAIVCLDGFSTDSCGVINKTGAELVPFRYDSISGFDSDLAAVKKDNKWGFVDKTGREVIPPKYDTAYGFYDGKSAEVTLNGRKLKIDKTGYETDLGAVGNMNTTYTYSNSKIGNYSNSTNVNTNKPSNTNVKRLSNKITNKPSNTNSNKPSNSHY